MSASNQSMSHRRIGAIFVEKQLITPGQLALALEEQEQTGRLLGEICVARFGVDRMRLADVLAEQWDGMQQEPAPAVLSAEEALRVLLDEAQATRAELRLKTGQLNKRLGALEALVAGVNDALANLTGAPGAAGQAAAEARCRAKEDSARHAHGRRSPRSPRRRRPAPGGTLSRRSGMGPVAQQVFKTCAVV